MHDRAWGGTSNQPASSREPCLCLQAHCLPAYVTSSDSPLTLPHCLPAEAEQSPEAAGKDGGKGCRAGGAHRGRWAHAGSSHTLPLTPLSPSALATAHAEGLHPQPNFSTCPAPIHTCLARMPLAHASHSCISGMPITHASHPCLSLMPLIHSPTHAELAELGPSERATEEASLAELLLPLGLSIKEIRVRHAAAAAAAAFVHCHRLTPCQAFLPESVCGFPLDRVVCLTHR